MNRPLTSQIVIDEFIKIIDSQDEKGIKKYGVTIDDAKDYNWPIMALEEAADQTKYLVKRIKELEEQNEKLQKKLDAKIMFVSNGMEEDMYVLQEQVIKQQKEIEGYIDDIEQLEGMLAQANKRIEELDREQSSKFVDKDNIGYKKKLAEFMQQVNPKPTFEQIELLKQQFLNKRMLSQDTKMDGE